MSQRLRALTSEGRSAVVTALSLIGAELVVVTVLRWDTIASLWELQFGTLWMLPAALLTLSAVSSLWLIWLHTVARPTTRDRVLAALQLAVFGLAVGYGVSTGRHFELWWRRAGFVAVCAGAAAWIAWVSVPGLRRWMQPRNWTAMAAAVLGAALCEAVNLVVLVRLYPAFHLALSALALGCLAFVVRCASGTTRASLGWKSVLPVAVTVILAATALLPASERLARFDNFRLVLSESAPTLSHAVRVAAWLSPPPPIEEGIETQVRGDVGVGVSLAGRDVMLITIDAVRADHVGAYGYDRPTTPNIDRLAAEGARFEWAYCATPHTSYSMTSLMTGKYIRPLLLQGTGQTSDTWASLLRTYEYRTAAFYPPAVFFIDKARFEQFEKTNLGFEYQKKEFLEGDARVAQVAEYVEQQGVDQPLFVWVHLFGPHEPYERHPGFDFGDRDVDRYDSEIAAADATVGKLVSAFRKQRPGAVVVVSSDHGEEFGDHGGRYHGSSVYEEQVRVPLVISAPGAIEPSVIDVPVQSIDLLPTVVGALGVPLRPRIRGRDLGPLLADGRRSDERGFAYAETDEHALLAEGSLRLVCQRKLGACRLYDLKDDPKQQKDASPRLPDEAARLRQRLQQLNASHGHYERDGLRAEGKGWPTAILRGIAGDGDAAMEIAELLDDADVQIRQKAAETLLQLQHPETAASLRLALDRDEDDTVRRLAALTLTRLGQGASLTMELLQDADARWRRWAALTLAESGDDRGENELIAWWMSGERSFEESTAILGAFGKIRSRMAVGPLLSALNDVRLRPHIARTLALIGDDAARGRLAQALGKEPYQTARVALAEALVSLGADNELVVPLRRWLGVPDPLQGGLGMAAQAGILEHLGGPSKSDLRTLKRNAELGELVRLIVPKCGNGKGVRLLARAKNPTGAPAALRVGLPHGMFSYDAEGKLRKARKIPEIHPKMQVRLEFPASPEARELHLEVPGEFGLAAGRASHLVVLAERGLELEALALVPFADELRPRRGAASEEKGSKTPPQAGNVAGNQ